MRLQIPRTDPQTMQMLSLLIHAGWACTLFVKPHLFEDFRIYAAFSHVMPTLGWAWTCFIVSLLLLIGRLCRPVLIFGHLLSCFVLLLIAVAFLIPNGLTTGLWPYLIVALLGFAAYTDELAEWLRQRRRK